MTPETNWGAEPWREPKLAESDTAVISECGRITHNVDYRSHWFVMVRTEFSSYCLLVKHGGGEERILMPLTNFHVTVNAILCLDSSDARYLMLHHLYSIHKDTRRKAVDETAAQYRRAFADGSLRKRKTKQGVKVWIEPTQPSKGADASA